MIYFVSCRKSCKQWISCSQLCGSHPSFAQGTRGGAGGVHNQIFKSQGEYASVFFILTLRGRVSMKNTLSYSPYLSGWVWKIHGHTHPGSEGEYDSVYFILTLGQISYSPSKISQDKKEWNTSHKRSGQHGFTHPSGWVNPCCPSLLWEVYTKLFPAFSSQK